jgi:hypothetical protein
VSAALIGGGAGYLLCDSRDVSDVFADIERQQSTVYDTVRIYRAVARDSFVVRYETRRLPIDTLTVGKEDNFPTTTVASDSIGVVIPITQKEYVDSTYHAWISGYDVNLDSIHTYTRHDITTITRTVRKSRHWGIGVTAGYGYTPQKWQPYVGVGINYNIITF